MPSNDIEAAADWTPSSTTEERIVGALIRPRLYWRIRAWRGFFKGEAELRLLRFLVDPARTSVDVGANKGVYTYFLSRLSSHVYAYEPNPKILRILRRGAKAANITISGAALSDKSGEAILSVPKSGASYSNQRATLRRDGEGEFGTVTVAVRRLDDEDVGDVGFIKIDVEGFETQVLAGARETIRRCRPILLIEIEEVHMKQPIGPVLEGIGKMGYRGLFLSAGRLRDLSEFDPAVHHDTDRRESYVFNFVFLPRTI